MKSGSGDLDSYKVNNYETLRYSSNGTNGTVDFPVPYVRGLLYDVTFSKQDGKGNSLSGAKFALYQSDGTTPVLGADGKPYEITTDKNTTINRFANLPWGDYVLKEIEVPKGYTASQTSWDVTLCYTTNKGSVTHDSSPFENNDIDNITMKDCRLRRDAFPARHLRRIWSSADIIILVTLERFAGWIQGQRCNFWIWTA